MNSSVVTVSRQLLLSLSRGSSRRAPFDLYVERNLRRVRCSEAFCYRSASVFPATIEVIGEA